MFNSSLLLLCEEFLVSASI